MLISGLRRCSSSRPSTRRATRRRSNSGGPHFGNESGLRGTETACSRSPPALLRTARSAPRQLDGLSCVAVGLSGPGAQNAADGTANKLETAATTATLDVIAVLSLSSCAADRRRTERKGDFSCDPMPANAGCEVLDLARGQGCGTVVRCRTAHLRSALDLVVAATDPPPSQRTSSAGDGPPRLEAALTVAMREMERRAHSRR